MRTIWKFPLFTDRFTVVDILMPVGAQIVRFDIEYRGPMDDGPRRGVPTVWAIVDDQAQTETRRFAIVGTGHELGEIVGYIGGFDAEPFQWHVVELSRPPETTWTEWAGDDEPPADTRGKVVEYRTRGLPGYTMAPADALDWRHDPRVHADEIVAYRIVAEQPEA